MGFQFTEKDAIDREEVEEEDVTVVEDQEQEGSSSQTRRVERSPDVLSEEEPADDVWTDLLKFIFL